MESRQVYNKAIALLARREHSEKELRTKLLKEFGDQEPSAQTCMDEVVERLKQDDYLSDWRFAMCYVRSRANRGFGSERIAQELATKGVDSEVSEAALEQFEQAEMSWSVVIEQVWRKKFGRPPENFLQKCKQARFLQYRGFSSSQIAALEAVWRAETP